MKSLRLYIIILSGLITIYLVAQFSRPKAIDWSRTYSSSDKIPFGTFILYNRINDIFPNARVGSFREPIYNVISDHGIKHGTYVIICKSAYINEYDYQKLIEFIKEGNDVFISASSFSDELSKKIKIETTREFPGLKVSAGLKFTNKYLDSNRVYRIAKNDEQVYFSKFNRDTALVLGKNTNGHVNFLKYPLGKGNLILNSAPLMFTNYSLLKKSGGEYAANALSFARNDSTLIWDQYYALGREDEGSSMRVFLRSEALRWAFYITFLSLLAFVLYEIKRRQRIIPIIETLENSTLSFVNIVGQVYYEQHDNQNICNKKTLYFLEHIRAQYNLKTNTLDKEFIDLLSQKTGIESTLISQLIGYINFLNTQQTISNKELIELNNLIEQFYIQAR